MSASCCKRVRMSTFVRVSAVATTLSVNGTLSGMNTVSWPNIEPEPCDRGVHRGSIRPVSGSHGETCTSPSITKTHSRQLCCGPFTTSPLPKAAGCNIGRTTEMAP